MTATSSLETVGRVTPRSQQSYRLKPGSLLGWPIVLLFGVAFAIRCYQFGNPAVDFDEQLYLLIGDRMLHGQLPYVDLWDRKPLGLFVIYALIRALGGSGIVQYQVVATLCAGATSSLVWAMARRASSNLAAVCAGAGYLFWLNIYHGAGGQTAVFYNLFTAIAAWAAFRSNDTQDANRVGRLGLLAMSMSGLAIQIKYVPIAEGVFFGCYFLWRLRQTKASLGRIAGLAGAYVFLAILPTLVAIIYYAAIGHLDAFVQANFVSIFERLPLSLRTKHGQYTYLLITVSPALAMIPVTVFRRWRIRTQYPAGDFVLIFGWLAAAVAGFCMVGNFYDFYFLPVLLPLFVMLAPLLERGRIGFAATTTLLFWSLAIAPPNFRRSQESNAAAHALADAVQPYVTKRCLYVYDGPTILYLMTHACAPTRFLYPDHLTNPVEAPALGVNATDEEKRVLAQMPGAIVTANMPVVDGVNPDTQRLVKAALARDYVTVARIPFWDRVLYVHALRILHPGPSPISDPSAADPA